MHCCLLTLSKIPRIQLSHSALGGGFQTPKGEFGAEMELKPHQDLCSGRLLLWVSWQAPGPCHINLPARTEGRTWTYLDVPASARCGRSRCSAASVRAQQGNTPSPALLPSSSQLPNSTGKNHSKISNYSKAVLFGARTGGGLSQEDVQGEKLTWSYLCCHLPSPRTFSKCQASKCNGRTPN